MPADDINWHARVSRIALPIILANVSVPLVGIVDTAVMGRMPSPNHLSAVAVGATLFSSIYWIFGFLRMGTGGLVAQAMGRESAEDIAMTTLRALLLGALIGVLLWLFQHELLAIGTYFIQSNDQTTQLTAAYFSVRILSAPATLVFYVIVGSLIGQQRMAAVLVLQLLLNILNIVLTLALFNLTQLGIKGVAIATVVSEYVTVAIGLWVLSRHAQLAVNASSWRWLIQRNEIRKLLGVSFDLFIRTLCLTTAFYWLTVLSSRQGETVLAANSILIHMTHLMAHGLDGFAHAAETLTGNAYGRRDKYSLHRAAVVSTQWAFGVALLFTIIYAVAGESIITSMTTIASVQDTAEQYLWWVILAPVVGIWSYMLDGIFIGTTHTREMRNGMLASLALFLIASLILVPLWDNHGLWTSFYLLMLARALSLTIHYPTVVAAAGKTREAVRVDHQG